MKNDMSYPTRVGCKTKTDCNYNVYVKRSPVTKNGSENFYIGFTDNVEDKIGSPKVKIDRYDDHLYFFKEQDRVSDYEKFYSVSKARVCSTPGKHLTAHIIIPEYYAKSKHEALFEFLSDTHDTAYYKLEYDPYRNRYFINLKHRID